MQFRETPKAAYNVSEVTRKTPYPRLVVVRNFSVAKFSCGSEDTSERISVSWRRLLATLTMTAYQHRCAEAAAASGRQLTASTV